MASFEPETLATELLVKKARAKIITYYCLLHYIDLNIIQPMPNQNYFVLKNDISVE